MFAVLVLVPVACHTGASESALTDYIPRYAHQAYGHSLAQARLLQTAAGAAWLTAAEKALHEPVETVLPHKLSGDFEPGQPAALGLRFSVGAARRLVIAFTVTASTPFDTFIDLFESVDGRLSLAASAAPGKSAAGAVWRREIELEVYEPTDYVLRVQPELLAEGSYDLGIAVEPVLAFPVSGYDSRAIQSGFGAERDGGRRAHRGVDIFAARGTDALAAVDAWVSRVDTTPRGGNVVWLQPLFGNMRLYYAHLDSQSVVPGQLVLAGDIVGAVGNTGNAITTPPHLHFGVYLRRQGRRGGARDPYDFLN